MQVGLWMFFVWIYVLLFSYLFFFFKQKTAYEMRISDWSSDVCSSDLIKIFLMAEAHMRRSGIAIEAIGKQWQGRVGAKAHAYQTGLFIDAEGDRFVDRREFLLVLHVGTFLDRLIVVSCKRLSVRVDLGGRRIIKNKKYTINTVLTDQHS